MGGIHGGAGSFEYELKFLFSRHLPTFRDPSNHVSSIHAQEAFHRPRVSGCILVRSTAFHGKCDYPQHIPPGAIFANSPSISHGYARVMCWNSWEVRCRKVGARWCTGRTSQGFRGRRRRAGVGVTSKSASVDARWRKRSSCFERSFLRG